MAYDLTSYVSPDTFRQRVGQLKQTDGQLLADILLGVCRVVDRRCGVAPGMFQPQDSIVDEPITFVFRASGGSLLRLRDDAGFQYFLRSVDTDLVEIDDGDGTYSGWGLDLNDGWLRGFPANAGTFSEPYTSLELLSSVSGADPVVWPVSETAVRITGDWGWATTPIGITERVIGITRELIDAHHAGMALNVQMLGESIERVPSARSLMALLEHEYSRRLPI